MSAHWTTDRGRGSECMIRLILFLARRLGRRAVLPLLHPIALYFVIFSARARRASRRYLARALDRPAGWIDVYRHYRTFAVTLLDRVYLRAGDTDMLHLRLEADARARTLIDSGPCVLLGAHLGSFEAARHLADGIPGLRVRPLMYRAQGQTLERVLAELDPEATDEVIELGEPHSLLRAAGAVQEGASVALLADRRLGHDRVHRCRFLGGDILLPEGPFRLAHALQVPVLLCFGLYRGHGAYEIRLECFTERLALAPRTRGADLQSWGQRFADRLAALCREAPYNWYNFFDVWEEAHEAEPLGAGRRGRVDPGGGR